MKSGRDGLAAFKALRRAGLATGACRLVETPSGGLHAYFQPSGNRNHTSRWGLDVRGDGGYVLAPPSIVEGRTYLELTASPSATGQLDWAACLRALNPMPEVRSQPRWQSRCRRGSSSVEVLAAWLRTKREGNRNNALFWAACRALESGYPDLWPLLDAARHMGLPEAEILTAVASARRASS